MKSFRPRVLLWPLLLCLVCIFQTPTQLTAATVSSISWDSKDQYNRFVLEFDALPKFEVQDSIAESKLYYIDLHGIGQNYKRRLLEVNDSTLNYVDAVFYEPDVLRLVFYVKDTQTTASIRTMDSPARLVIDSLRAGAKSPDTNMESATAVSQQLATTDPAPTPAAISQQNSINAGIPDIPAPRARPSRAQRSEKYYIVIDPGHGGPDSGAVSKQAINGQRVMEKDLTLTIAYLLKKAIDASPNMVAFVTRVDDSNVGLRDRVRIAERHEADLFISLHINYSTTNPNARGVEVYFMSDKATVDGAIREMEERENREVASDGTVRKVNTMLHSVLTNLERDQLLKWQYESYIFAKMLERSLITDPNYGQYNRGVKSANFAVLKNFEMPAVLLEVGFITNPEELALMNDFRYQQKTANLIYNAIAAFFATNDEKFKPQYRAADSSIR